jgi:hypothetical protein
MAHGMSSSHIIVSGTSMLILIHSLTRHILNGSR